MDEPIDHDELDMIIQDAVGDGDGRLYPKRLLDHLAKHGWTITMIPGYAAKKEGE